MLRNAEGEEITLTRAERRRLEKMRGKPVTYQYTLDQIEAIKRQAVADKKESLKKEIAAEIDEHIQKEWETREELLSGSSECERMEKSYADEVYKEYGIHYQMQSAGGEHSD